MKNLLIAALVILVLIFIFRPAKAAKITEIVTDKKKEVEDFYQRYDEKLPPQERKRVRPVPSPVLTNTISNGSILPPAPR